VWRRNGLIELLDFWAEEERKKQEGKREIRKKVKEEWPCRGAEGRGLLCG
jgi:hypothetical protein